MLGAAAHITQSKRWLLDHVRRHLVWRHAVVRAIVLALGHAKVGERPAGGCVLAQVVAALGRRVIEGCQSSPLPVHVAQLDHLVARKRRRRLAAAAALAAATLAAAAALAAASLAAAAFCALRSGSARRGPGERLQAVGLIRLATHFIHKWHGGEFRRVHSGLLRLTLGSVDEFRREIDGIANRLHHLPHRERMHRHKGRVLVARRVRPAFGHRPSAGAAPCRV